jgi:hypothetical protein
MQCMRCAMSRRNPSLGPPWFTPASYARLYLSKCGRERKIGKRIPRILEVTRRSFTLHEL